MRMFPRRALQILFSGPPKPGTEPPTLPPFDPPAPDPDPDLPKRTDPEPEPTDPDFPEPQMSVRLLSEVFSERSNGHV